MELFELLDGQDLAHEQHVLEPQVGQLGFGVLELAVEGADLVLAVIRFLELFLQGLVLLDEMVPEDPKPTFRPTSRE